MPALAESRFEDAINASRFGATLLFILSRGPSSAIPGTHVFRFDTLGLATARSGYFALARWVVFD